MPKRPYRCPLPQEINALAPLVSTSPPGSVSPAEASEEFVDITVEFVGLTSKSSKVAEALYRTDESAYRAACGRTHTLLSKKRRRPLQAWMKPDCLAMMQFGRGMKIQVGGERWELEEVILQNDVALAYIFYRISICPSRRQKVDARVRLQRSCRLESTLLVGSDDM